ncbi:MAG: dockerin type I domain-containing protein [Planctomycetota bacterium]
MPWQVSVAGAGSGQGVEGQVALAMHSVYRQVPGWSVSMLGFRGGATMTGIASDIAALSEGNETLGNVLAEHWSRQRSAGGRGRVVVFIQGGINSSDWWFGDPPSPSDRRTWTRGVESIRKSIRHQWEQRGFPAEDLAFIVMASHQADALDHPLRFLRPAARSLVRATPDACAVSSERLVSHAELSGDPGFYAWDGPYHLSRFGFEQMGTRVVSALLSHAAPSDLVPDGVVNALDLAALVSDWGAQSSDGRSITADIDRSGRVDALDLMQLLEDWGGSGQ